MAADGLDTRTSRLVLQCHSGRCALPGVVGLFEFAVNPSAPSYFEMYGYRRTLHIEAENLAHVDSNHRMTTSLVTRPTCDASPQLFRANL